MDAERIRELRRQIREALETVLRCDGELRALEGRVQAHGSGR